MDRPTAIYSPAQVRALDAYETNTRQVPSFTLMTRAAQGALRILRARWPQARRLAVVCGAGNNGGDGYVLARLARAAGLDVQVFAGTSPERLTGDARRAQVEWSEAGGALQSVESGAQAGPLLADCDVVVDGLLGIGLTGAPRPGALEWIRAINAAHRPVLALDVPSGVDAGSGAVADAAVKAEITVCFVALKAGLFLGAGAGHAGVVLLEDLGVVAPALPQFRPLLQRISEAELAAQLPRRGRDAHKGTHGRVLIIGGGSGMPGALRLAGEAALRSGAGLVTVAGAPENLVAVIATRPELIYLPVTRVAVVEAATAAASVIAIGPGLGQDEWSRALWSQVRSMGSVPVVADADALNLLAAAPAKLPANWVLTPHPGEAARLLGTDIASVQADRLAAVRELHVRYGAIIVLKGAGTLVAGTIDGSVEVFICDRGNPGMATAGMGDVLTGVIAGLLAQLTRGKPATAADALNAARLGVLVHALAGDSAAQGGQRGLLASDVVDELRGWVNP